MTYTFEGLTLDTRRCELRANGTPQHLEPQVYAVLCYLIENRDRLVRKEELLDHVWGHRFVTPATLNSRIKALRQALGDDGRSQRIIETVRGRGFRFVAPVEQTGAPPGPQPARETPPPGQQIRFCRGADGTRIAFASSGSGPILLKTANWLTHLEYDWNSPVWRHWLTELSRDHTLVRYDQRGGGLSDREVEDLSFEAWVSDLEALVDELELERVPLLGISQGCAVATAYAARHPERVSKLMLYGGYPLGRYRRARSNEEAEEARLIVEVMPHGWGRDNPAFRQFFANLFLPEGTAEQHAWFSDLQRVTTTSENGVRLRTTSAEIDIRELARKVAAPTLVLHATGDAAVPFEQGRLFAALIPGARLVPIESRNHILLESEPGWSRFLDEVRAFLAADTAAPRMTARDKA